jgi:hypothetical protein
MKTLKKWDLDVPINTIHIAFRDPSSYMQFVDEAWRPLNMSLQLWYLILINSCVCVISHSAVTLSWHVAQIQIINQAQNFVANAEVQNNADNFEGGGGKGILCRQCVADWYRPNSDIYIQVLEGQMKKISPLRLWF